VDDVRLGTALRKLRFDRGLTQAELARRASVSASLVSKVEHGKAGDASLAKVRSIATALDARLDVTLLWQGGELDKLLNRRHSGMHEAVARLLAGLAGWTSAPEVSFSIYGERGYIDILAWHAETRTLLVIELKTEIVDVQELVGKVDQKRRLASRIARERGWVATSVSAWVVVAESRTNRRRLEAHRTMLRAAFPTDGRSMAGWLRRPSGQVSALSFLSNTTSGTLRGSLATPKRVRHSRASVTHRAQAAKRTPRSN
jgi:HTH-type transcriptional regulator/antitoxin HipB